MSTPRRIYLIAGEASGDFIGGRLMESLRGLSPSPLLFSGIGGEHMMALGLRSLFPMQQLSVMGFAEVLPHIFTLKRRIRQTVSDIMAAQPDLLITIDSPGFTYRVVRELKAQRGLRCAAVHYVAPTVWAYKPERAAKTAALFDRLLVLLPFEPPYFTAHNLPTDYVGHPVVWEWKTKGDGAAFRSRHQITRDMTVVGMMPGSRKGEIKRHLPIFEAAIRRLMAHQPNLSVVMPVRSAMLPFVSQAVRDWPCRVVIIEGDHEKKDAFAACDVAVAKSGTVALEVTLAGIPMVTAYRANPISVWLIRRMIRIAYVHLINIIAGRDVVPELIQERCNAAEIADHLWGLLSQPVLREAQLKQCREIITLLGADSDESPSDKAAKVALSLIQP